MLDRICRNCIFNSDLFGKDPYEQTSLIQCSRFIPHISNTQITGNLNQPNIEILIRKSEVQEQIMKKESSDLPYILVPDNFGCNQFQEKNLKK